jgi:hypothetical protein
MPVTPQNPFQPDTTLSIDIANRLHSLRAHPGFYDLVRISEETVKEAEEAFVNFTGWDKEELAARSLAFRSANKHHQRLWEKVEAAITNGIEEARQARDEADPYNKETADMADNLRTAVLRKHSEAYDTRVPGTY